MTHDEHKEVVRCCVCDDLTFDVDYKKECFICSWLNYCEHANAACVSMSSFKDYYKEFHNLDEGII